MSRKTVLFIVAIIGAILTWMTGVFGLSISAGAVVAGMMAVVVYIFGEMKNDISRIRKKIYQDGKWRDPAFWTSLVAALLPVINSYFKLNIPVETIVSILTVVLAIIFGKRQISLND